MLERLLRKSVPRPILRQIALYATRLKRNTIDKLLYGYAPLDRSESLLWEQHEALPELQEILDRIDSPVIKSGLGRFLGFREAEFIFCHNDGCFIEPEFGWGINRKRQLIGSSLANASEAAHLRKPSLAYIHARTKTAVHLEKAISLRDSSERAYFHFYNDVVAKIPFLLYNGIDISTVPLIISAKTFYKPFFQELLQQSNFLSSLTWLVQHEQLLFAEQVIFCRPRTLQTAWYKWIAEEFNFNDGATASKRIFLTRHPKRLRYLENLQALEPVLNKYHFEIVDTDELTVSEQARLFAETKWLIGIHGAGMTNMLFAHPGSMRILELFPPGDMIPYHYAVLAHRFGHNYDAIAGDKMNSTRGWFSLKAETLENAIIRHFLA